MAVISNNVDSTRSARYAHHMRHATWSFLILAAVLVVVTGAAAQSSTSGGTVTTLGVITPGHCVSFATVTSIQDAGGVCGTGGGTLTPSGTITAGQIAVWATSTSIKSVAVSGDGTISGTGVLANTGLLSNALPALTTGALNWTGSAWAFSAFGNVIGSGVTTAVKGQGLVASGVANTLVPTSAVIDIVPYVSGLTAGTDYAATISAVTTANPGSVIDLRGLPSKVYLNSPMIIPAAFLLTAVANASGGNTVYTGTFPAASMASACAAPPCSITIAGFLTGANNGAFNIVSSTTTTLTVANAGGVAGTCPTNCTNATSSATRAAGDQFTGTLMLGNTVFFINNVTGLQTFGGGVNVEGNGRTNNGIGTSTDSTSIPYSPGTGTDFELCSTHDTLVADYSTYCASTAYTAALTADGNNYPAIITMNGYLASAGAVGVIGSTQFASRITGISVGCGMQANAVGFANASSQEGSTFSNFYWHDCTSTANIGLDLGMGTGGAQNSWYTDCQGSTIAGKTNVTSAVGIRVFAATGNGLPSGILRCSVVNNVGSNNPNYDFEYVGGTQNVGEFILGMSHFESASIAGIAVGVATVKGVDQGGAANGLLVLDDNCGPGFSTGATTGCIRVFSTGNLSGALATNLQVLGTGATGAGSAPTNLIADDNNTVIPIAAKFIARYETDGTVTGGKTLSDTSSTNKTPLFMVMTQDCAITAAGVITCTKTNNVAFATSATTDTTNATNITTGNVSSARMTNAFTAPPPLGATTPSTGKFTTLGTTGLVNLYNNLAVVGNGLASVEASPAVIVIGSGTSIGSTSLCSTTLCPAGTYRVNAYVDLTTACGTSGTYIVNLIYTDDQGSKTIPINLNGTGTVPATGTITTTSTANYGENAQVVRSTGAASINYSTTATACGTAGPMVGNLYLSVDRLQ